MEIFALALAIDLLISDNLGFFHPVVLIGKFIAFLETRLFALSNHKMAGIILVSTVTLTSFGATFALLKLASLNKALYLIVAAFLIATTFAFRGLLTAGYKILQALKANDIRTARNLLSRIVGRDTQDLDRNQIIKATVESLAENTVDGIIAPLFYAFIGGAALAFLYRSINTLDSMVGYKNKRYKDFGWAAAKLDDIANFIPARLGLIFLWLATLICRLNFRNTIKISIKDGPKHASPNSGLSEAAFAAALGIQLGGAANYQGVTRSLPTMGANTNALDLTHINKSLLLICITTALFLLTIASLKVVMV